MKPAESRRLALESTLPMLREAESALLAGIPPSFEVRGNDRAERLTHVLIAKRIRARLDDGADPVDAFRAVMKEIRRSLTNHVPPPDLPEAPL